MLSKNAGLTWWALVTFEQLKWRPRAWRCRRSPISWGSRFLPTSAGGGGSPARTRNWGHPSRHSCANTSLCEGTAGEMLNFLFQVVGRIYYRMYFQLPFLVSKFSNACEYLLMIDKWFSSHVIWRSCHCPRSSPRPAISWTSSFSSHIHRDLLKNSILQNQKRSVLSNLEICSTIRLLSPVSS